MRGVGLGVRAARFPIEHVVGRIVDKLRIYLAARQSQIANPQCIRGISGVRFALGDIHLVISRAIEHKLGIETRYRLFQFSSVADIDFRAPEAFPLVATARQFTAKLNPKLTRTSENNRSAGHSITQGRNRNYWAVRCGAARKAFAEPCQFRKILKHMSDVNSHFEFPQCRLAIAHFPEPKRVGSFNLHRLPHARGLRGRDHDPLFG